MAFGERLQSRCPLRLDTLAGHLHCTHRMRYQGRIGTWKDEQGYGFIRPDDGDAEVFLHIRAWPDRRRRPEIDDIVSYELGFDARGRARADKVARPGEMRRRARSGVGFGWGWGWVTPLFAGCFVLQLALLAVFGRLPKGLPVFYLLVSVVTFAAYAFDKSAARRQQWRTRESTLHLLALCGGWPGALAAQRLLRHKLAKRSFLVVCWGTVVLNCTAFGWWFFAPGARSLIRFL